MRLSNRLLGVACVVVFVLTTVTAVSAQNALVNSGFEDAPCCGVPPSGWVVFGNAFTEGINPPQFVPFEGVQLCSMFGPFAGGFGVSGIFQEFVTQPFAVWTLSANTRHWSGDAMVGVGNGSCTPDCTDNWVVQKLAWFDVNDQEIGGVESVILDGTFATDVWHDNPPIVGVAPIGTVKVQALILYLQGTNQDGGAAQIDHAEVVRGTVANENSTWGKIKSLYTP